MSSRNPDASGPALLHIVAAAGLYFALVFTTGFILGPIRVLVVAPQLGERAAQLLEAPVMLAAIVLAARWIVRRYGRLTYPDLLAVGVGALACVLTAEFAVVKFFWRMSVAQYLAARDAVGLAAYVVLLVLFAAMPLLVARRSRDRSPLGAGPGARAAP